MTTQSEYLLEERLLKQLEGFEYERIAVDNEPAMLANLKRQLEKHNGGVAFTADEFDRILESPQRIGKIVDYVLAHHAQKTKRPDFTAMFCVGSVEVLCKYYEAFMSSRAASCWRRSPPPHHPRPPKPADVRGPDYPRREIARENLPTPARSPQVPRSSRW